METREVLVEPDVIDNIRPPQLKRKKRKDKYIREEESPEDNYDNTTEHYKSTNRWILVVFAGIVILLVLVIIYLIYRERERNEITYSNNQQPPDPRNRYAPHPSYPSHAPQAQTTPVNYPSNIPPQNTQHPPHKQQPHNPQYQQPVSASSAVPNKPTHDELVNNSIEDYDAVLKRLSNNQSEEEREEMRNNLISEVTNQS